MRNRILAAGAAAALAVAAFASSQSLKTPAEECGFTRYSQHSDVSSFLKSVDEAAPEATVQVIGRTLEAKGFPAADLLLCVIAARPAQNPARLDRKEPTVLVVASQHGNEQSGKEAALRLVRDLALGELKPLLRKLNFLVIPQANPYGNSVDRRQNEQDLDLNRDHVKLEAPETRAIHAVFRAWMPEVTLDVHEKGDDYYRVSTGCVSNINIHQSLQSYSRRTLFPAIVERVESDGFTWHEYLVTDSPTSGRSSGAKVQLTAEERRSQAVVRYSTPDLNDGRNSFGIYETLSFIQEGASRHDVATLEARTRWQFSGIRGLVEAVAANASDVLKLVRTRRQELLRNPGSRPVQLRMQYVRDSAEPELVLKRFPRQAADAGGEPEVVTETVRNWLPVVESRLATPRPSAYVVPSALSEVVKTLRDHGIALDEVPRDREMEVESYTVREISPARADYEAPERIVVEKKRTRTVVRKGDVIVRVDQPAANLIPCLLEPESEYGLIRYRSYGLIPDAGGTFPILRK